MVLGNALKTSFVKKRNTSASQLITSIMPLCVTNRPLSRKLFARWSCRKTLAKNLKSKCFIRIPLERWMRYREGKRKRQVSGPRRVVSYMKLSNKEGLMLSTTRRETQRLSSKKEPTEVNSWISLKEISIRIWSTRLFRHFTMSRESAEHSTIKGNRISKMHGSNKLL